MGVLLDSATEKSQVAIGRYTRRSVLPTIGWDRKITVKPVVRRNIVFADDRNAMQRPTRGTAGALCVQRNGDVVEVWVDLDDMVDVGVRLVQARHIALTKLHGREVPGIEML